MPRAKKAKPRQPKPSIYCLLSKTDDDEYWLAVDKDASEVMKTAGREEDYSVLFEREVCDTAAKTLGLRLNTLYLMDFSLSKKLKKCPCGHGYIKS